MNHVATTTNPTSWRKTPKNGMEPTVEDTIFETTNRATRDIASFVHFPDEASDVSVSNIADRWSEDMSLAKSFEIILETRIENMFML